MAHPPTPLPFRSSILARRLVPKGYRHTRWCRKTIVLPSTQKLERASPGSHEGPSRPIRGYIKGSGAKIQKSLMPPQRQRRMRVWTCTHSQSLCLSPWRIREWACTHMVRSYIRAHRAHARNTRSGALCQCQRLSVCLFVSVSVSVFVCVCVYVSASLCLCVSTCFSRTL